MRCATVKVACNNEAGFYVCNADAVPAGAVLFDAPKQTRKKRAKAD